MSLVEHADVLIVSVFCAGGLFAYVRETLRLSKLLAVGKRIEAKVLQLEQDDAGESVKHYLVTYEFMDDSGKAHAHTADVNSYSFFRKRAVGETIPIVYYADTATTSYPFEIVQSDRKLSLLICLAIVAFWLIMVLIFTI